METQILRTKISAWQVLLLAFCIAILTFGMASYVPSSSTAAITPPSFTETASYTIWKSGSTYYAKNGLTAAVDYSSRNATWVIQSAVDAVTNGGKIFLLRGQYTIDTTIIISNPSVYIEGEGTGYDVVKLSFIATSKPLFKYTATTHKFFGGIKNLCLDGNGNSGTIAIHVEQYYSDLWFEKLFIMNFLHGIKLEGSAGTGQCKIWNIWILDCLIESNNGYAVYMTNADHQDRQIDRVTIRGGHFYDNTNTIRIDADYVFNVLITDITVEKEREYSIYMTGGRRVQIVNNRIFDCGTDSSNTYDGIYISGETASPPIAVIISGNNIGNHWVENQMRYCVHLNGTCEHIRVSNNIFESWKTASPTEAVNNNSTAVDVVVENNQGMR